MLINIPGYTVGMSRGTLINRLEPECVHVEIECANRRLLGMGVD